MKSHHALSIALLLIATTACGSSANSSLANGTSIFQTGKDVDGAQITAQPPALRPSCAACHLANGSGGVHDPMMPRWKLSERDLHDVADYVFTQMNDTHGCRRGEKEKIRV